MKIAAADNRIERSGIENQTAFSIKASGKAFKILSDGLYSNKIAAVVRELSCNGYDAHIAAGKKHVPITLHIPTRIEPWFSVKDYGIGLDHEDVIHLYSTYFESTKNTSNDFVGAFGLGSKSPFSYVDSFTVTSRFNGIKRTYTAYITEEGIPNISLIHTEETVEGNGIEVQVPVKEADIQSFSNNVQTSLKHFEPLPETNVPDFDWNIPQEFARGEDWVFFGESRGYYNSDNITAIQGQVAYAIDSSSFNKAELSENAKFVLQHFKLNVHFEIGELEVAASRESLSYNKQTVQNINKKLDKIVGEFETEFWRRINSFVGTEWERVMFHRMIRSEGSYLFDHFNKDNKLATNIEFDFEKVPETTIGFKQRQSRRKSKFTEHDQKSGKLYINPTPDFKIFVKDCDVPMTWIAHYFETNNLPWENTNILVLRPGPLGIQAALAELGNPAYMLTSSLAKPPRRPRLSSPPQSTKMNPTTYDERKLKDFEGELPEKGFFVVYDKKRPTWKDKRFDGSVNDVVQKLIKFEWIDSEEHTHLFYLTKKQMREIKDNKDWVQVLNFAEQKLGDWFQKNSDTLFMSLQAENNGIGYYTQRIFTRLVEKKKMLEIKGTVFESVVSTCEKYRTTKIDTDKVWLAKQLGFEPKVDGTKLPKLDDLKMKLYAEYPMLKHAFENHVDDSEFQEILDYVKLVEASKLTKAKD